MAKGTGALLAVAVLFLFGSLPGFTSPFSTRHGVGRSQSLLPRQAGSFHGQVYGLPIDVFSAALSDAAAAKKEAVPVMQDMLYLKDMFTEMDPQHKGVKSWMEEANKPSLDLASTEIRRAEGFLAATKAEYKSTVVPKFIKFMAKKMRLDMLRTLAPKYVKDMYALQSIAPVMVESAAPLSDEQTKSIKDKLAKNLGVQDIKLAQKVNPALIAGFKLYWDFLDPEKMREFRSMADYSFAAQVKSAAIDAGVAVE